MGARGLRSRSVGTAAALLTATLLGCGKSAPPRVHGQVTINGTPVKLGDIAFVPVDGAGAVAAGTITDGAYSVEARPGAKRVEIQAYEQQGSQPMDPSMPGSAMAPVMKPQMPEKYNSASELTLEVSGEMEKNFELTLP